ncbi:hypothetical protein [Limnobacter parvus]|uniref:J domain-containing protein n=1 Tax=Limnobacter parvus TaxID=2939690 RepID=A0ABT1XFW9_9BURK|nr:hypothetical protein [Limnobacter parvus]MCR2746180.1 hypothetical protein [Limnobacter parvus]
MTMPPVLRKFATVLLAQNLRPHSQKAVCGRITAAVAACAQKSPNVKYTIDPTVLQRVVGEYLQTHPTPKPLVLTVTDLGDTCHVEYHDMCYGTNRNEQGKFEFIPQLGKRELVDGKYTSATGAIYEGKWQYVEQLKSMHLLNGSKISSSGSTYIGKWQYVEQLKEVCLVEGKALYSNGSSYDGQWQYIEQMKSMHLVDGKVTYITGKVVEGKRQYVEQFKAMCLIEGEATLPNGDVYSGTFAYVPGVDKNTQLINGTLTYSIGRSETGEFAYIPQLNGMKLVNGATKDYMGDVWFQGRREYVPQINGMALMEGLSVSPDGTRQEGTYSYVPELNEVVLTAGSITQGDDVQTGTWAYCHYQERMVFTPPPPKLELPQYVCNQIQSSVQELVRIQRRFDTTGKYSNSAAKLNTAAQQALLAHNPEQYDMALQGFTAQYKKVTRELSLLTHPDKIQNYSADIHGAALQKLADLRESIGGQVSRWSMATDDWR